MVNPEEKRRIVFVGAGNLATHVASALHAAGHDILQIYSRTETSARALAERLRCDATSHIEALRSDADIYLFAVSDAALEGLIATAPIPETAICLHTAGSIPMTIFKGKCARYGVFYPLQTFSKNRAVQFDEIPLFIEGSSPEVTEIIRSLAQSIVHKVIEADSEQRKQLHLAAVFACNFTNHMYAIAAELLDRNQLPLDALRPLIRETAAKIDTLAPIDAQTGPAMRYDRNVMQRQIDLLASDDEKEIYRLLSKHIHHYATTLKTT